MIDIPTGDWIQTYTGGKIRPLDPDPADVKIEDIAHALSNQCRFTGHVREFYSIAQHCVLVSRYCEPEHALWGLLHDAAEAYVCDMARPVKYDPRMSAYKTFEKRLEEVIAQRFGLSLPEPPNVKDTDRRLLLTERRDLLPYLPWNTDDKQQPFPEPIVAWLPREAEVEFLVRYEELTGGN